MRNPRGVVPFELAPAGSLALVWFEHSSSWNVLHPAVRCHRLRVCCPHAVHLERSMSSCRRRYLSASVVPRRGEVREREYAALAATSGRCVDGETTLCCHFDDAAVAAARQAVLAADLAALDDISATGHDLATMTYAWHVGDIEGGSTWSYPAVVPDALDRSRGGAAPDRGGRTRRPLSRLFFLLLLGSALALDEGALGGLLFLLLGGVGALDGRILLRVALDGRRLYRCRGSGSAAGAGGGHHPLGVGRGLALEAVGRVADLDAAGGRRAVDRPAALLDDVGQLVGQRHPAGVASPGRTCRAGRRRWSRPCRRAR